MAPDYGNLWTDKNLLAVIGDNNHNVMADTDVIVCQNRVLTC